MKIRTAIPADIPDIVGLIQQLALHDGVAAPDSSALRSVLTTLLG